jgi:membrane protein YqaA with SNARE-associated domain
MNIGAFIGIGARLAGLTAWLIEFGPLGLFLITLLDSAFVPMPSGPDILMIALSTVNPGLMPVYALAATLGSTLGCAALYWAARRGGTKILTKVSPEKRERVENLLGRYDALAVVAACLMPPPFPFKIFVLCAGVLKFKMARFVVAVFVGRLARFLFEGWLATRFGNEAGKLIARHGWLVLALAGLPFLIWLAFRFWPRRAADL